MAGKSFGSTKSGIAPFYSDKYAKIGFQVSELFGDEKVLMDKVENVCSTEKCDVWSIYIIKPALDAEGDHAILSWSTERWSLRMYAIHPHICANATQGGQE